MPLGVTTARAGVMDWTPGAHASTFGGNPVSCAAALTTIRLLQEQLVANAADVGGYLLDGLRELQHKHAIIGDVRGKGLMIGIELVKDRVTKVRATAERDRVVDEAFARGLLILGAGRNTIRLSPPLVLTRAQARIAIDILDEESIGAVARIGRAERLAPRAGLGEPAHASGPGLPLTRDARYDRRVAQPGRVPMNRRTILTGAASAVAAGFAAIKATDAAAARSGAESRRPRAGRLPLPAGARLGLAGSRDDAGGGLPRDHREPRWADRPADQRQAQQHHHVQEGREASSPSARTASRPHTRWSSARMGAATNCCGSPITSCR